MESIEQLPPLDQTVAEVVEISRRRERRAMGAVVAGIIWSFTYTAISLLIMYGVSSSANQTCEQLSDSRETVRALILTNPGFDMNDKALLDEILPPIVCD